LGETLGGTLEKRDVSVAYTLQEKERAPGEERAQVSRRSISTPIAFVDGQAKTKGAYVDDPAKHIGDRSAIGVGGGLGNTGCLDDRST
jgi:hypothetical protein